MSRIRLALLLPWTFIAACFGFEAVYPPRPPAEPGEAIADPTPTRVVLHATVTSEGMRRALEQSVPESAEGVFTLLGTERRYTWRRGPVGLRFSQGRIELGLHVDANADMPIGSLDVPLDIEVKTEPVVTSEYMAKLQASEVKVRSDSRVANFAERAGDVLTKIQREIQTKLDGFSYDLKPTLSEAYQRLATPIDLPLGDAKGCASLQVLGVEAGPTVLADGIEKDLAIVIAPSVTIPCAAEPPPALPPLANVATLQPGPFTVTVPVAARYDELAKAMTLAFKDGKLFFSKEFPELYLESPEVYAARDQLVLKLHLAGPVEKAGINTTLDGDIYMAGHPIVEDNELRVPDLEPTIETSSFLLKLKAALDGTTIRDQARAALRLDIGKRLRSVRDKLSTDLAFASGQGCLRAQAHKIEVSGVHVHSAYLRVYVDVTASTAVYLPCPE